jgi:hypothetical protein
MGVAQVTDFMVGMAKSYRKKPIVVLAIELKEDTAIDTLEGTMLGHAGDFLIRGIEGEVYPCKRDIFLKTYEPVSE